MHRQFSSGGTEKDVARWLKEMGYRGPGLKKENLMPLCRGEMQPVWEGLIASCRPEPVVKDMQRKVQLKLQRQAALESRQKTQEDAEKRQRQIERIKQLQKQCKEHDANFERLKADVESRTRNLAKLEERYGAQKEKMQRQVERSKIVTAFVSKTEEATGSVTKEMECLQKRNATAKRALEEKSEVGWADFESVMGAMHDFTSEHMSEKLRTRGPGQMMTAEDVMPKIEAQPEIKDPAVSRLMSGIGQLYSHHTKRLTEYFDEACRRAQVEMTHFEAKYRTTMQQGSDEWGSAQMAAIEEMQVAYLKSFLAIKQTEERTRQRMASLKNSEEVQRLLLAVEQAGLYEMFNCKLDARCLDGEITMLKTEIEKLEVKAKNQGSAEKEAKEMWRSLKAHVEQSHQIDVIVQDCMRQIKQLQQEFDSITAGIAAKVERELPQAIELCLESLQECENGMRNELEAFLKLNLNGRMKTPGLEDTSPPVPSNFPLMQRTDLTTESEPTTYWTASMQEMEKEIKQTVPSFKMESPDALFTHIVQALTSSLLSKAVLQSLRVHDVEIAAASQHLCSHAQALIQKDKEREAESAEVANTVDGLLSKGHETLYRLQTDVTQAFEEFREQPAFSSVPWLKKDGMHAQEWVAHKRLEQNPSSSLK